MDWKEIIDMAMQRNGLTQVQLAERVQCGQATISDLRNGATTEPRYSLGRRLLELAHSSPRKPRKQPATQEA
jgi:predicted transcriptional regulator